MQLLTQKLVIAVQSYSPSLHSHRAPPTQLKESPLGFENTFLEELTIPKLSSFTQYKICKIHSSSALYPLSPSSLFLT